MLFLTSRRTNRPTLPGETVKRPQLQFVSMTAVTATLTVIGGAVLPVHAQSLYLTSGSYSANTSAYRFGTIYVGKDVNGNIVNPLTGLPYVATLNVVTDGIVGHAEGNNASTINITGEGGITDITAYSTSTFNVSGGSVNNVNSATLYDSSTLNINSGRVSNIVGHNSSVLNISGGTVAYNFSDNSRASLKSSF